MKRLSPNAYGLRRQLTYEEVAGMLDNSKLFTPLPEYPYTEYKDSFEGSYFDNITERIDLLKDQQQRILERQMTEAMLRKEATSRGVDINVLRAQTAPAYYDIGDPEESEARGVSSFTERGSILEDQLRDLEEREARDRERSRSSASRLIGAGMNTVFHGLARQFAGSSGSAPSIEPRLEKGVSSDPVEDPEGFFDDASKIGRPRTATDYTAINPDTLDFGRLRGLFLTAIKNKEVSPNGIKVFDDIIKDRSEKVVDNATSLNLLRSLFKKEFIDEEFVTGKIAQRGKQYTDTLLRRAMRNV